LDELAASLRDGRITISNGTDREILKQQHADDVASVRGFQLHALGEKPQDNCGRDMASAPPTQGRPCHGAPQNAAAASTAGEREQHLSQSEPEPARRS